MTLQERADQARELLQSEAFKAVLRDTREQLVASLESVPVADHEIQHEAVLTLQLLKRFETQLHRYISDFEAEKHKQAQESFVQRQKQYAKQVLDSFHR